MHHTGLEHVEFERDLDPVQLGLIRLLEVDYMSLSLGHADANVEGVDL